MHRGVGSSGWKLDYRRFRSWVRQKFGISDAYLFIGMMSRHADLYTSLQSAEYHLVFKEVVFDGNGKAKGNCDADLVLHAVRHHYEIKPEQVVLVSSDGDYAPLVRFWLEQGVRCTIISPSPIDKCSILLKRTGAPIVYLQDVQEKVAYRQK